MARELIGSAPDGSTATSTGVARVGQIDAAGGGPGSGSGPRWLRLMAVLVIPLYLLMLVPGWLAAAFAAESIGIRCARASQEAHEEAACTIGDVRPDSPADRAGLRPGDVVLALDGIPWDDNEGFGRHYQTLRAGQHTLRAARAATGRAGAGPGSPEEVSVTFQSWLAQSRQLLVYYLVTTLAGLLFLAVGLTVGLARPGEPAAGLVLAGGACVALALAVDRLQGPIMPLWLPRLVLPTGQALGTVGAASVLHLFLVFPAPHPFLLRLRAIGPASVRRVGGATLALYGAPAAVVVAVVAGPWWRAVWGLSLMVWIALLAAALLAIIRSYRHPPTPLARAQLKWILWALVVNVGSLAVLTAALLVTGRPLPVLAGIAMTAAAALFPLAVAFAVLRYRLFDVQLVVRATVFYPLLAALLVAGYFVVAYGLGRAAVVVAGPAAAGDPTLSVAAALAVAALAHPLHRRLQSGLDHLLYRARLARHQLLVEAAVALGHAQPQERVAAFLTEHTVRRLDLVGAWLVLPADAAARGVEGPARTGAVPALVTQPALPAPGEPLLARLAGVSQAVVLVPREDLRLSGLPALAADEPTIALWYVAGARVLVPLRTAATDNALPEGNTGYDAPAGSGAAGGAGLLGVWVVGARRSGDLLDREDVTVLGQIGEHATLLLDYERLHRQRVAEQARLARLRRFFSPQIADLIAHDEEEQLASHRRELTVLFADVRGFTALSETLEPEELITLLNEHLAAMTEVLFGYGGTLDKYLGDGILAFFGDPLAQPDHAERAVRAGLAMQQRLTVLQARWFARGYARLTLGVGINTGWVTVGTIGSEWRQEYTVIGDNVNVAARLSGVAGPGEVLLSEKTWRVVEGTIPVAPRGAVELKGKHQPVPVFAAVAGA